MNKPFWKGAGYGAAFSIGTAALWYSAFALAQNVDPGFITDAPGYTPAPVAPGIAPIGTPVFVNVGSLGSDVLTWMAAVFTPVLGSILTAAIYQFLKKMGIDMTDAMRARLQEVVVNGLNIGAAKAEDALRSAPAVDVKSTAVAHAIEYVQAHGADTLKALGFDPKDQKTIEAIQARAESAILNPNVPTASILNPDVPKAGGNGGGLAQGGGASQPPR